MPKIASWDRLPQNIRQHLVDRMRDRSISIDDLNQLRLWIETQPEVPEGDWFIQALREWATSQDFSSRHSNRNFGN